MTYYKTKRIVDGNKPIWVIVDENSKVVNRDPSKDELKKLKREILPKGTVGNSSQSYHRIKNLYSNNEIRKGYNFEELTCRWRSTVSTIPVENMNKYYFNSRIDHSRDSELGFLQTKGRFYNTSQGKWDQSFKSEHGQIADGFSFDTLIMYCASKDGKIIERIYIFPLEEVLKRISISIYKNPMDRHGAGPIVPWYEKYRVKDEKTLELINKLWNDILRQ